MKNINHGFTLIELVVVIVILGILAATAAPKFIDLSSDARIATLESLEGSMRSASSLVNLKAKIENKIDCSTDPTIAVGDVLITLRCGYPCPHPSGIARAVDTNDSFTWIGGNCGGQLGAIEVRINNAPDPTNCKIRYSSARANRVPSFTPTTTGC
jgi:MSHA pilin protein MshA